MWILVVGARIRAGGWIECVLRMWLGAFAAGSVWRPMRGSDEAACLVHIPFLRCFSSWDIGNEGFRC